MEITAHVYTDTHGCFGMIVRDAAGKFHFRSNSTRIIADTGPCDTEADAAPRQCRDGSPLHGVKLYVPFKFSFRYGPPPQARR